MEGPKAQVHRSRGRHGQARADEDHGRGRQHLHQGGAGRLRLYHLSFTQTLGSGGDLHGEGEEGDARMGVGQRISKLISRAEIGATAARCAADVGVDEVWPEWKHGKDEYGDSLLTLHGKGKAAESLAPPPQRASPLRAPTDGIECMFTP